MTKRTRRNRNQKRQRRRNMRGGAFSQDEIRNLRNNGFEENDINTLSELDIPFNIIMQSYNTVSADFNGNSDDMIAIVMNELTNRFNPENQQQSNLDNSFESQGSLHVSDLDESQGPMNPDELNISIDSMASGYTTDADEIGGKKRRKTRKMKGKKGRKTRRYKLKGGACYGTGVGANNYDPNFTIYNTNMLKLFPYKPN